MFDYELFGKKIKFYRLKQGLTLEVLAERANITDKYLSRIEHAHHKVSTKVAVDILNALSINFHTCLYNTDYDNVLVNTCMNKFNELSDYEKEYMIYILENLV